MGIDITYRRICWPTPDGVCLEGGCLACNDNPYRHLAGILDYARTHDLITSYNIGESHQWHNAHTRKTRP
jgi:hypothetical protein